MRRPALSGAEGAGGPQLPGHRLRRIVCSRARPAFRAAAGAPGLPLMILLVLDPSSQAACGGTPTGPGPASVPGIPQNLLPIFEGASQQFQLGNDGWAYLAALNYAESSFGTDNGSGTGVLSGSNYAGAAGPMQIGIGGAATDNWSTVVAQIPPNLPGGAQPPSVYNEVDVVYGASILLKRMGAPGDWHAALVGWNDYPPEIAQVTQLVAQ
jgi:peptidoglycan DL-endopeptidase CwlO